MTGIERGDRWCILRTPGSRTLPLARSLAGAGIEVWTPAEMVKRRRPRSRATDEIQRAMMPTFVFARASQIGDIVAALNMPVSPHPVFSIFTHAGRVPLISEYEIAGLRAFEDKARDAWEKARAAEKRRSHRYIYPRGAKVTVPDGPFAGLVGIVEDGDGKFATVSFGGWSVKVGTWLILEDVVDGTKSIADTAARAA